MDRKTIAPTSRRRRLAVVTNSLPAIQLPGCPYGPPVRTNRPGRQLNVGGSLVAIGLLQSSAPRYSPRAPPPRLLAR